MTSFTQEETEVIRRRTSAILKGDVKIHSLDLHDELNCAAVLSALTQCQRMAESLNVKNKGEEDILVNFIGAFYPNFFFLTPEQYTAKTVREYLYRRFTADLGKKDKQTVDMAKSLDGDIIFLYRYGSSEDEVITYFEGNMNLPVHLKATIQLRLRLTDPVKFIQKLNIDMHILDLGFLTDFLNDMIASQARDAFGKIVEEYHPGYFALSTYYSRLNQAFGEGIGQALEPFGIVPDNIAFKSLSATDDSQEKIEDSYFFLSKKKLADEASLSYQEQSLKLFEKKAEIINKYPQVEDTLTEAEKDNALSRYLKKAGVQENAGDELTRKKLRTRAVNGFGDRIQRPMANRLAPPPQTYPFRQWLAAVIVSAVLCLIFAIIGKLTFALFAASALTLILGLIYSLRSASWKKSKIEKASQADQPAKAETPAEFESNSQGDNDNGNIR